MKLPLIAIVLLSLPSAAIAMIGDNSRQIEARYGQPQRVMAERGNYREVAYVLGQFAILVKFIDGVSKKEGMSRLDLAPLPAGAVKELLDRSAPKSVRWQEVHPEEDSDRTWKRSDGKAKALLLHRNFLVVQDVNYVPPK